MDVVLQIKVGIQLSSLKLPLKKALLTAAQLGADAVEIDVRNELPVADMTSTAIRQIRKMLEDLNLRVSAVAFPTRNGYEVAEGLERRIEATRHAMELAYQLGTNVVVNHIGRVPEDQEGPQWHTLLESLTDLGRHGQHIGAFLAAKTGTERGAALADVLKSLPTGSLVVDLDPGGMIVNDFSPLEAVRVLGPHIMHVHAKDGVRDLAQGRGVEVPLGRGSAEFPELLGVLEENKYRGYFTIERRGAEHPVAEIGDAVQYLRAI